MNKDIKVDIVRPDEIGDLSEKERNEIFNREASVDAIPDLDVLTGHVYDILKYLESAETKKLMKQNASAVKMYLNNKYADTRLPFGIITLLMEEEGREKNVEMLMNLFTDLAKAKRGEISLDKAEMNLSDNAYNRHMKPKYGSKEDFAKELSKMQSKMQTKDTKKSLDNITVRIKN